MPEQNQNGTRTEPERNPRKAVSGGVVGKNPRTKNSNSGFLDPERHPLTHNRHSEKQYQIPGASAKRRVLTAHCFDLFVQSQFPFPLLRVVVLVSRVVVSMFLSLVCWFVVLLLCCSLLVVGLLAFVVCLVACLVVGLFVRLLC